MPRVSTKTKSKGGKTGTYQCDGCSDPIVPGQKYFEWSFRYGGTHRQHVTHGAVKQSQLTQSKMSGVYAAVEAAESALASAESIDDIKAALDECKDEVTTVRDEYQEAIDAMISPDGAVAQECQEKIEALESFAEELESTSDNIDEYDDEEEPAEPEEGEINAEAVKAWEESEPELGEGEESPEHKAWAEREPKSKSLEEWEVAHAEWETNRDQWLEDKRSEASDALGNLSI